MRRSITFIALSLTVLLAISSVSAQCNPPNISATIQNPNVKIGTDLVIDYVTPRHMNGKWIYTLYSLTSGTIPIDGGYCLPLGLPINLLGASFIAAGKSQFRYTVPNEPALAGVTLHLAGMVMDGTPAGTGASNGVLCTIRLEDWPLP
jgi:hypothetical protein